MTPLAQCLAEQREARDNRGPDMAGAWKGLCDWTAEEVIIRLLVRGEAGWIGDALERMEREGR